MKIKRGNIGGNIKIKGKGKKYKRKRKKWRGAGVLKFISAGEIKIE